MTTIMITDIVDDENYDATTALFNRGEWMRKLRDMEREDEEERRKDQEQEQAQCCLATTTTTSTTTSILSYADFLATQSYYDDYKHVNYQYIDFARTLPGRQAENNDDDKPLILEQDRSLGKGGMIWDAGFILAEHVIHHSHEWTNTMHNKGRRLTASKTTSMVELGAGTGVTGLLVARACPNAHVHLTDLPLLMPLLERNVSRQYENDETNTTFGVLPWGQQQTNHTTYDVILGADVVAGIYDSTALFQTISDLAHEQSRVYIAYRDRMSGLLDPLQVHMNTIFSSVTRVPAMSSNKSPNVWILCATGKRRQQ